MAPLRDKNEVVLRARALRRIMTLPEGVLWRVLRRRPEGFKFRRQHPVGRFIADFYCPAAALIIEVDGEAHNMPDRPQRDAQRDVWMREQGLRVFRIAARDVMSDETAVVAAILAECRA
jgi:very-short-patch-repair endonuclease